MVSSRRSIGSLITLITCAVALVAVLATAVVGLPLARRAAHDQSRRALANQVELAAPALEEYIREYSSTGVLTDYSKARVKAIESRLTKQGIKFAVIIRGKNISGRLPATLIHAVASGRSVSQTITIGHEQSLVEGRALGHHNAVVLTEPLSNTPGSSLFVRLFIALLVGLAAGAIAGALLARWLTKPLRRAALAARQLKAGKRDVRLQLTSPAEVADVSGALNELAAALAISEGRQREFLLSVSHELRTPLTTIRGYAEALTDQVETDPQRAGQIITAETQRLDRLVGDLLGLSRLEADDFRLDLCWIDLVALVRTAGVAWQPTWPALTVELPDQEHWVRTDPIRLRQVIDAFVDNAVRIIPSDAPLILALTAEGVIQVRDGGPGLSDEDIAVAFDKGVLHLRYKSERGGSAGLGLALAARLIQRLGGTLQAGRAPEGGASFTICLPAPTDTHPTRALMPPQPSGAAEGLP